MHAWLHRIDQHFPVRYTAWFLSAVGFLLCTFTWIAFGVGGFAAVVVILEAHAVGLLGARTTFGVRLIIVGI